MARHLKYKGNSFSKHDIYQIANLADRFRPMTSAEFELMGYE